MKMDDAFVIDIGMILQTNISIAKRILDHEMNYVPSARVLGREIVSNELMGRVLCLQEKMIMPYENVMMIHILRMTVELSRSI